MIRGDLVSADNPGQGLRVLMGRPVQTLAVQLDLRAAGIEVSAQAHKGADASHCTAFAAKDAFAQALAAR